MADLNVDLSPISIGSLLKTHHPYGVLSVYDRYGLKRFTTACRIHGKSYKSLSPSNAPQWDDVKLEKS